MFNSNAITATILAGIISTGIYLDVSRHPSYVPTEELIEATYVLRGQHLVEDEEGRRTTGNVGTAFHIGDGYFLSAEHNLRRSDDSILQSRFAIFDDDTPHSVNVVWESSEYDVILVKVDFAPDATIRINCDVEYTIDTPLRAIGNPIGLRSQVTYGRVGNLQINENRRASSGRVWSYTQTFTIPIREGMSGGPIVNDHGELIGIGVGSSVPFATSIPIEKVCELLDDNPV